MIKIINSRENRILLVAVVFSAIAHFFWISVVGVVTESSRAGPIKFSNISFLGPISSKAGFELKVKPKNASFLEKRYRRKVAVFSVSNKISPVYPAGQHDGDRSEDYENSGVLTSLIEEALGASKLEPPNSFNVE